MNKITAALTNAFAVSSKQASKQASKVSPSKEVSCFFSPLLKFQTYSNPYFPETNADGSAEIKIANVTAC